MPFIAITRVFLQKLTVLKELRNWLLLLWNIDFLVITQLLIKRYSMKSSDEICNAYLGTFDIILIATFHKTLNKQIILLPVLCI